MPRPNKILEPTKTYNLLMKEQQYDKLAYMAHHMQKSSLEQVANRDTVRKKDCVDYLRLVTIFIGKSENECRLWVDRNKQTLVKLGTPYEVA